MNRVISFVSECELKLHFDSPVFVLFSTGGKERRQAKFRAKYRKTNKELYAAIVAKGQARAPFSAAIH